MVDHHAVAGFGSRRLSDGSSPHEVGWNQNRRGILPGYCSRIPCVGSRDGSCGCVFWTRGSSGNRSSRVGAKRIGGGPPKRPAGLQPLSRFLLLSRYLLERSSEASPAPSAVIIGMKFEGGRYKTRLNLSGAALPCLGHPYGSTSMPTCERLAPPGLYLRHLWFRTSVPGRTNCLWNAFRLHCASRPRALPDSVSVGRPRVVGALKA